MKSWLKKVFKIKNENYNSNNVIRRKDYDILDISTDIKLTGEDLKYIELASDSVKDKIAKTVKEHILIRTKTNAEDNSVKVIGKISILICQD